MELTKVKKEDFLSLSLEKKGEYVLKWKYQGISVTDLASFFGVSKKAIYNWLHAAREPVLAELEAQRPIDIVVEHMHSLQTYIDMCLYEATQASREKFEYDPKQQTVNQTKPDAKAFNDSMRSVQQFQKMLIDLQQSVGILPKKSEQIYHVVSDNKVVDSKEDDAYNTSEYKKMKLLEKLTTIKALS